MLKELVKWVFRTIIQMITWVYVLSLPFNGLPLYEHARSVLVDNRVVDLIEEYAVDFTDKISGRAKIAIQGLNSDDDQSVQ
ncbi:MAG: hypothetical protein HYW48_05625 [Deltaproteobacteria bacterium]|nr:hypothetical protein [Deltaproteobacteria bacterium]